MRGGKKVPDFKKQRIKKRRFGLRKTRMMLRVPETRKDQRSFAAEEVALKTALYWKKKKVIKDVTQTIRFSPDDLKGIDLIIEHLDGKILAIDVKTYWNEEEEEKCREKGVALLPVGPLEDEKRIRERMLALILLDLISGKEARKIREIISFIRRRKEKKESWIVKRFKKLLKRIKRQP